MPVRQREALPTCFRRCQTLRLGEVSRVGYTAQPIGQRHGTIREINEGLHALAIKKDPLISALRRTAITSAMATFS